MKRLRGSHILIAALVVASTVVLVRRVSANAPVGRYVVAGDGTVYDTATKLTWQQAVDPGSYNWSGANMYCQNGGPGVGNGSWRLPSFKELATIFDETSTANPPMDTAAFPGQPVNASYWTASVYGFNLHWYMNFNYSSTAGSGDTGLYRVRCVY